jgi:hypothetical protein
MSAVVAHNDSIFALELGAGTGHLHLVLVSLESRLAIKHVRS